MEPSTSSEAVTRQIIEMRKAIQRKCNLLKRSREDIGEYLKEKYKPVIDAVNRLSDINTSSLENQTNFLSPSMKKKRKSFEVTPQSMIEERERKIIEETPLAPSLEILRSRWLYPESPENVGAIAGPLKEEVYENSPQSPSSVVTTIEPRSSLQMVREEAQGPEGKEIVEQCMKEVGEVASKYIKKLVNNDIKDLDTIYGIVYDGQRFTVGDNVVSIQNDVISVGEVDYYGTPGLFELLFMANPKLDLATKDDFDMYKKILNQSNAHKKEYSPTGPIRQLKNNLKYKNVISKLFPSKKGSGIDDPNILVNRLRKLIESPDSDKNRAEIHRIESQLRIGGIIA